MSKTHSSGIRILFGSSFLRVIIVHNVYPVIFFLFTRRASHTAWFACTPFTPNTYFSSGGHASTIWLRGDLSVCNCTRAGPLTILLSFYLGPVELTRMRRIRFEQNTSFLILPPPSTPTPNQTKKN